MAKALRVFIVLILLLSIGALVLGVLLFQQRTQLKGRAQKLEQAVVKFTDTLKAAREPHIAASPVAVDANALMQYENMDGQIRVVQTLAENRYQELSDTYDKLKTTRDELADTRQKLADTQQQLADARTEITQLKETLTQKEAELAAANQKVADLTQKVAGLEQDIASLKGQLAKVQEEKRDLQDVINRLERQLAAYEVQSGGKINLPAGLSCKVLVVNPDWNFVVLSIGKEAGLVNNAEMLVHRADTLVGKVRISNVTDKLAVADIVRDFMTAPIQEGDTVFFPGI